MKAIAYADFDLAEYQRRVERTQEAMDRAGLDALILTEPANLRYLFGFQNQLQMAATSSFVGLFPRERPDDATLFIPPDCQEAPQSWVEHVVFWGEGHEPPFDLIFVDVGQVARCLDGLGLAAGRLGLELGLGCHIAIPIQQFDPLRELLHKKGTLVDGSEVLWQVRRIKSEAEIDCLRRAARISLGAIQYAIGMLREGITEGELYRLMFAEMFRQGIDGIGLLDVQFGLEGYRRANMIPTDQRALQLSEWVYLDGGGTYHGYNADICRMAFLGESTRDRLRVYEVVRQANQAMIEAIRPGVPCSRVFEIAMEVLNQADLGYMIGSLSVGHGLGLNVHELPDLSRDNHEPLEEGMVINVEPWVLDTPNPTLGLFNFEDTVVVREDGPEILTREAAD